LGAWEQLEKAEARLLALGGVVARRAWTQLSDGAIHHLEAGHGRPLILLHGAGGGGANWYRIMGRLAERHRVIAPDLPGFGFSDPMRLRSPLGVYAAERMATWLRALQVGACDVVGTSFGALVALRLAQRSEVRVERLVLVDGVGLGRDMPWLVRLACTRPGGALLLRRSTRTAIRMQLRLLMMTQRLAREHEDALVDYLHASASMDATRQLPRALLEFGGLRGQLELLGADELRALALPVLLVWGGHDRFTPLRHAQRALRLLPDAQLRLIADAGHSPNWETPDALLSALDAFLPASS
jgi:pimeloyl-ACP methyl ester carboxylesterase